MSLFLITTADERSWEFDRPVLFLGEWCRLYNRKQIWGGMDAIVAEPYGVQAGQKARDVHYIQVLSSQLLIELTDMLNCVHNTNHSVRYWNILLGRWLQRYVSVTFNRYFTLEQALDKYEVYGTRTFDHSGYSLATNDSLSFIYAYRDDVWNHVFYAKIFSFLGGQNTDIDSETLRGISCFTQDRNPGAVGGQSLKHLVQIAANRILPKLSRNTDALIINSYLPRIEEVKLQISLAQFPQLWKTPQLCTAPPDQTQRQSVSIDDTGHQGFECYVRRLLSEVIPSCFIEGYQQLVEQASCLPFPTKPKFIFTSNNFDTDELFKAWTGSKIEEGTPYFVGQHGNHYGTRIDSQDWPEVVTSDKFLTWGWADGSQKIIPTFVLKLAIRNSIKTDPNGGLLLIEDHPPILQEPEDSYFKYGIYQDEQFRFVDALPEIIQEKLTVRLHGAFRSFRWHDEQRWKDRSPYTHVETGTAKLQKLIGKSRLVIHSYDSTGILETLALNIPTMCFWYGGLDHLLPSARPYYELLRKAGILLDTPDKAAAMVALHWDNVNGWWGSREVQHAREVFCNRYAKVESKPVRTLSRLLTTLGIQGNSK